MRGFFYRITQVLDISTWVVVSRYTRQYLDTDDSVSMHTTAHETSQLATCSQEAAHQSSPGVFPQQIHAADGVIEVYAAVFRYLAVQPWP